MAAYYNEIDPKTAAWLRELIARNLVAPGDVDERSIVDVRPDDLRGYAQCHFFAGIGVWSYALRRAGWGDSRRVWTGSCPCQPFSDAGAGDGFDDPRHLWPHFFRLISGVEQPPLCVFGEQVASKAGLAWLDLVSADMEGAGYAVGAADLCAAGVGSPNMRQRFYWVADAPRVGSGAGLRDQGSGGERRLLAVDGGELGDTTSGGRGERRDAAFARSRGHTDGASIAGGLGDSERARLEGLARDVDDRHKPRRLDAIAARSIAPPGAVGGFWGGADWIYCRDERWRPVEPGTSPLATGAPARVVRLRGYGNAINAEVATEFIQAYLEVRGD